MKGLKKDLPEEWSFEAVGSRMVYTHFRPLNQQVFLISVSASMGSCWWVGVLVFWMNCVVLGHGWKNKFKAVGLEWLTHTGVWNGFHVVYPALQHLTDQNYTSLDLSCGTKTCLNSPTLVVSYEGALFFLPLQRGAPKNGFRNPFSMMVGFCNLSGFNLVWLWSPTPRIMCGLRNLDLGFLISDFWFLILDLDVWSCTFGLWNLDGWFGCLIWIMRIISTWKTESSTFSTRSQKALNVFAGFVLNLWLSSKSKISKGLRWSNPQRFSWSLYHLRPSQGHLLGGYHLRPQVVEEIYLRYLIFVYKFYCISANN